MATAGANAPIIIKRKKVVGGGGHHGGAWKVAYADFVTAMMAFFLLMWLLNATTETQRKGIADYFAPTVSMARVSGGGDDSFGGDSVFSEESLAKNGTGASARHHDEEDKARGMSGVDRDRAGEAEGDMGNRKLEDLANKLSARSGESMVSEDLARHIVTRVTDVGLVVELFDLPGQQLFDDNSSRPLPLLQDLVGVVAGVFALADNRIAINGHVRSEPVVRRVNPVWDLSTDRATAVRRLVDRTALDPARLHRVTGLADRELVAGNPLSVRNNRIELVLLRDGK
ncbi:OmpA/MotB family protein [Oceaniglobus roseus]|uniref:OmpA/MotB family protein n=1 Tax=Oceaniglobus roseus TaxID=1737570 RepID=UPI000C7F101B|nr:flagellar motor protein MotB [Kandeliimicrobium roseum]